MPIIDVAAVKRPLMTPTVMQMTSSASADARLHLTTVDMFDLVVTEQVSQHAVLELFPTMHFK